MDWIFHNVIPFVQEQLVMIFHNHCCVPKSKGCLM